MSDIVERLRWWGAKQKPPKGMETLPADCREAADEFERLRGLHSQAVDEWEAWKKRAEEYGAEIERLRGIWVGGGWNKVRSEALEEAAKVAAHFHHGLACADAIRALKQTW